MKKDEDRKQKTQKQTKQHNHSHYHPPYLNSTNIADLKSIKGGTFRLFGQHCVIQTQYECRGS